MERGPSERGAPGRVFRGRVLRRRMFRGRVFPGRVASARLVAPEARRLVAGLVIAGVTTTAVLGARFAGESRAGPTEAALAGRVEMGPGVARTVGEGLADLGGLLPVTTVLLVLAVAAARSTRRRRGLALVLLGPPLAMVTTSVVLKPLVGRTLDGHLAYPSGHTTSAASTAVVAAVLLLGSAATPRAVRRSGGTLLGLLVLGIGVSLVGRGYHYPTDVAGALGVSTAVVLMVALVIDVVADRSARPDTGDRSVPASVPAPPRPTRDAGDPFSH